MHAHQESGPTSSRLCGWQLLRGPPARDVQAAAAVEGECEVVRAADAVRAQAAPAAAGDARQLSAGAGAAQDPVVRLIRQPHRSRDTDLSCHSPTNLQERPLHAYASMHARTGMDHWT